jgi:hypothetical protein
MTNDLRAQLEDKFRAQQRFADGYSPLYARLFGIVAEWLAEGVDPVVDWLVAAAADRAPFDVTLLLPAALHRDVLAGEAAAARLAGHFPTASGNVPDDEAAGAFAAALRDAILARREPLAAFIRRANVQTNETGRGIAWLLPLACVGWPAVHLVELGASAGLNLVAERRGYRLVDPAAPERVLLALGEGPAQFTMTSTGGLELPAVACCPRLLSRTGGDIHPFHLRGAADELTLAAYVWGDQPARLARLREGIAALREVEHSAAPVGLFPLRLPDELPRLSGGARAARAGRAHRSVQHDYDHVPAGSRRVVARSDGGVGGAAARPRAMAAMGAGLGGAAAAGARVVGVDGRLLAQQWQRFA